MAGKLKVLNLYAGVGGNRKLWAQDYEVTAVENHPKIACVYKRLYPNDELIIGDAHQYLLENYSKYDFIWTSPPCQSHSKMNKFTRHNTVRYFEAELYQEIVLLQHFFKGKYVVENVIPYYEPFIKPTAKIDRHLFWTNFEIAQIEIRKPENFINLANLAGKQKMMDWLDIHFEENIYYKGNHCPVQILRNCVHPIVGKHILDSAALNPLTC